MKANDLTIKVLSMFLACLFAFFIPWHPARADEIPTHYIEAMLLTTVSEDRGEFSAVGYDILGKKKDGRDWYFYLAASVGRYGYMGGYCTDVANTFLALYFGDGSNCFDTYDIDPANAQPGDVVFYSDGGTGYQHYAIYLGGEMSLQGNWLGTTVIRSVYINGSAPQFRRCSGH